MQSWQGNSQNGNEDQWQSNFNFTGQDGQFDPNHAWSQPMGDQPFGHINPQDGSAFFESPHQGNAFLGGNLHGSPPSQQAFHASPETLTLNQQFSQAAQDVIDPAFSDIHADIYGHQGKMNLGDSISHLGNMQSHNSSPFNYSFGAPNEQPFDSSIQQYAQSNAVPQPTRQQSHTPVQQFDGLQAGFPQSHGFNRPPQQSPIQTSQTYNASSSYQPPVNGQSSQYQANTQPSYQQPQPQPQPHKQQSQPPQQSQSQPPPQPQQQLQTFSQSSFVPQKQISYQQPTQGASNQSFQQPLHQQATFAATSSTPSVPGSHYSPPQQPSHIDTASPQSMAAEPPAKKRKRVLKSATESLTPEPTLPNVESPADLGIRRTEDLDGLVPPIPSPEEATLIAQFNKRSKAAQLKQPSIKGLPHMIYDASTKIPAPKSYDKLAPLVAIPSRSGKPIVPEFGYNLPCEIQGRFTTQYRPAPDRAGLDERRIEARVLLDEFERSMKAMGKRRPKYTEYPHAFKEQLKSDEASKNKAEKRAKKEQEEVRNKPSRAATRPSDPIDAAVWDILGIVHIEQGVARTNALIATRVQQAGDFIIKLRGEMNRSKQELDQAIKDKGPEAEISKLRHESEHKKQILYRVLDAALEHADDSVLDNMGGHQKLILSLVNALIMCIKSNDFSGKLPKIVLELFTHFPMTKKIADTTNFETVRKRFADKGDEEVKGLVQEISANIRKVLKATEPESSTGYTGTSAASRAKAGTKSSSDHTSKRGRDDDSDLRTVKKIAVESTGSSLSKKLAQPKIQLHSASKTTAAKAAANSILPGKSRPVAKSVPKPDATKTDAKSGGEDKTKPDAKNGSNKTDSAKSLPRTETRVPLPRPVGMPSASASASSGIASLLDSINAPKAEAAAATMKDTQSPDASETPEERAKRLKKEARRKLRVSWKPESELVQVKIFQKEEAEDEGRDVNMIRDAGDDRSEGMVLKQRANVEEDDDDDDIPYTPWLDPMPTDFSSLTDEARKKNFVTRGGEITFSTDEQQRIADREHRELMAIYTDFDDIPPTPKSPPPEMAVDTDAKTCQLPTDDPKFQEIQLRWRDEQQVGVDAALYAATKRLDAKSNPSNRLDSILDRLKGVPTAAQPSHQPAQPSTTAQPSGQQAANLPLFAGRAALEQVVGLLKSDKAKTWRDPNPSSTDAWRAFHYADPTVRMFGNAIEMAVKSLAGKPFPATTPPDWIKHDAGKVREWHLGYSKELAARQKAADEERARAEAETNALRAASGTTGGNAQDWMAYYAQQQAYAPYMALLQQMNGGQQAAQHSAPAQQTQIPASQLQSILAAINQPTPQQAQQPAGANAANYLNPNDPSYQQYMLLQQMAQGQQAPPPPPPPPPAAERDRDRDRDRGEDHHASRREEHRERERERDNKEGRRKRGTLPPHKPANKALIGTKPCTFWQQGKCARGDKCTFRHD